MKKIILFLLTSACYMSLSAQNPTTNNSDTCVTPPQYYIGAISNNTDNSVFTAMQNIWFANEKISYLCVPRFYNLINPVIPLREGEGKSGNYLFEANLFNQTPIAMGRNHSNHFWQTSRITFDFGFNVRMALDSSSPLIPNNNVIGLTLNKGLWDSKTKKWGFNGSKKHSFRDWVNKEESLHNLSLNITAHHYSNGQQPGFFLYDTINGVVQKRNDYRKGDFSTNYI